MLPSCSLYAIGSFKKGPEKDLFETYQKRLKSSFTLIEGTLKESPNSKELEAQWFLSKIPVKSYLIVLDERGKDLSSEEFAKTLEKLSLEGISHVSFLIGGAHGLSTKIQQKANLMIRFGKMTWPHLMVRAMLLEQLYRAQQILLNHPYHK